MTEHRNWRVANVPGAASLPHFENITGTLLVLSDFWQGLPVPAVIEG